MLAMARVLRSGATLLLLDEPSEGLAPVIVQRIGEIIRTIKAQGTSVLLVEQNVTFAATVADRHHLLAQGRVVEPLDNDEFRARERSCSTTSGCSTPPSLGRRQEPGTRSTHHPEARHPRRGHDPQHSPSPLAVAAVGTAAAGRLRRGSGGPPSDGGGKLTDDKVVLGVLNDQSGVYKDLSGPNSKVAVEMAIEDYQEKYGDKAVAKTIEVITADHQNKPDIANTKAQEMYDRQKADIILDVPTSSAALAVAAQAKAKKKLYINIGAGDHRADRCQCNKYTFH